MSCIYVLSCENNTYYIGRTTNVVKRFNAHRLGLGSMWTQEHKPLAILELIDDGPFVELVTTLQYMYKYGLDAVRGGPWCTIVLTSSDIETIQKLLASEGFQRSEQPVVIYHEEEDFSMTNETNANNGKKWDSDQISKLVMHITDAMPLKEIAKRLQRTEGAIRARVGHIVRDLHDKGVTEKAISNQLNLIERDVQQCLNRRIPDLVTYLRTE